MSFSLFYEEKIRKKQKKQTVKKSVFLFPIDAYKIKIFEKITIEKLCGIKF